jgi:uncharacterized glyoxalase superfamily protein PhnB
LQLPRRRAWSRRRRRGSGLSHTEADGAITALNADGKVDMPLAIAPWGPYFGMCADRLGVHWMVSLPHPA